MILRMREVQADIILDIDRVCMALFSALEQTRCAPGACDSEWVAFHSEFSNIHPNGLSTALFGFYVAGATRNCVHHTAMLL